jgi:hypothetical protein
MELEAEPKTLVSGSLCEEKTINPRDGHYLPSASLLSWPLEKQKSCARFKCDLYGQVEAQVQDPLFDPWTPIVLPTLST